VPRVLAETGRTVLVGDLENDVAVALLLHPIHGLDDAGAHRLLVSEPLVLPLVVEGEDDHRAERIRPLDHAGHAAEVGSVDRAVRPERRVAGPLVAGEAALERHGERPYAVRHVFLHLADEFRGVRLGVEVRSAGVLEDRVGHADVEQHALRRLARVGEAAVQAEASAVDREARASGERGGLTLRRGTGRLGWARGIGTGDEEEGNDRGGERPGGRLTELRHQGISGWAHDGCCAASGGRARRSEGGDARGELLSGGAVLHDAVGTCQWREQAAVFVLTRSREAASLLGRLPPTG
jgi:hypothetical protein